MGVRDDERWRGVTPRSSWGDVIGWWVDALSPARWAPSTLTQPILPGWSFGPSLVINEGNSASPTTEVAVLREQSYGRQLGRLGDALEAVVEAVGPTADHRVEEFLAMQQRIAAIKEEAAQEEVARLRAALDRVRRTQPEAFEALLRDLTDGPGSVNGTA
ncbi:hypothetical protein [Actinomycetospora sp. TBRC 11914]|uniref:hypothetical protein n=1 Tax=Actinomycetospora sp. TBRC 11914 TaxID=2729387 RepID=UPI00145EBC2D|nr:hypothetical protein [Actinomycetospora sp. TBRC 11914]NMO91306.1 hypothetical protein [Actinomycetospora sp. TBRC 11914]